MEDYDMEDNIKDKFNLKIYQNQSGSYNLSQDNKYKFYALMIIIKVDSNIDA